MANGYVTSAAHSIPDITGVTDYTIISFFRPLANVNDEVLSFGADNFPSTRDAIILPFYNSVAGLTRMEAYVGGTGGASTNASNLVTTNTWHCGIATRSGTTVTGYVDGTALGNITVGSGSFTIPNCRVAAHFFSGTNNQFGNTQVAMVAICNRLWTAGERAAADKFIDPMWIAPDSVIRYIDLTRTPQELITNATVTAIGSPTIVANPGIVYRRRSLIVPSIAAAAGAGGMIVGSGPIVGRGMIVEGSIVKAA